MMALGCLPLGAARGGNAGDHFSHADHAKPDDHAALHGVQDPWRQSMRLLAGERQIAERFLVVGRGAGLIEMVCQARRHLLGRRAVQLLQRGGDAEMQPLPPRQRQVFDQGLSDQLVREGVTHVPAARGRADALRPLGRLQRVQ